MSNAILRTQTFYLLDEIVRGSVQLHGSSHGSEVTVDLGVAQPENGEEQEDRAGIASTRDLAHELIVPSDTGGDIAILV